MGNKRKAWTNEDTERLKALVETGASAMRASVVLGRQLITTKNKARELGLRFPTERETRRKIRKILETN
jgi:hypothetical protein